jgi:hypothetical protein
MQNTIQTKNKTRRNTMPKYVVDKVERTLRNVEQELAWHIYCADNDEQAREDNYLEVPAYIYDTEHEQLEQEIEMLGGALISRIL